MSDDGKEVVVLLIGGVGFAFAGLVGVGEGYALGWLIFVLGCAAFIAGVAGLIKR